MARSQHLKIDRLIQEGQSAFAAGDHMGARATWSSARKIARRNGDFGRLLTLDALLGTVAESLGKPGEAAACYGRALAGFRRWGFTSMIAMTQLRLGRAYFLLDRCEEAAQVLRAALPALEREGRADEVIEALMLIGLAHLKQGEAEQAVEALAHAAELTAGAGDAGGAAPQFYLLAQLRWAWGQPEEALSLLGRCREQSEQMSDQREVRGSLIQVGRVYERLGRADLSGECYERALERVGPGEEADAAFLRLLLGNACAEAGRYVQALKHLEQAVTHFEAVGEGRARAACLECLGHVYFMLGQHQRAMDLFQRAIDSAELLGDPTVAARALFSLGRAFDRGYQYTRALTHISRAAEQFERSGSDRDRALALAGRGQELLQLGRNDAGIRLLERAVEAFMKAGDRAGQASALHNLGLAHVTKSNGRPDEALPYLEQALALRRQLGNGQSVARTLGTLAIVQWQLDDLGRARESFEEAIHLHEAVAAQVPDPVHLADFQNTVAGIHNAYASLLVMEGKEKAALAVAERGRGQALARQAARMRLDLGDVLPPAEADRLQRQVCEVREVHGRWRAAQRRAACGEPSGAEAAEELRQECRWAELRLDALYAELYAAHPALERLHAVRLPDLTALEALARREPETLFLESCVVNDESTLLFALSANTGCDAAYIPVGWEGWRQLVRAWREALAAGDVAQEREAAAAVAGPLLASLEEACLLDATRFRRLTFVPDRALHAIPFAALTDSTGGRLVDRFAVSVAPSLTSLLAPTHRPQASGALLCIADPLEGQTIIDPLRGIFGPLPGALREAELVAAQFPGATVLLGGKATRRQVLAALPHHAVLHFASHGWVDPDDGLASGLLLAPETEGADGFLEARELLTVPCAAELAVLSACRTGGGHWGSGEGLIGFVWALQAAGCPSVLASLWDIGDAVAAELTAAFYKGLRAGQRKDDALREAACTVRNGGYNHPRDWAAFQLIGNSAPLSKSSAGDSGGTG
jgi:CHAT domain-containing protein/tetratricopeptide (TPR) repeat protein